jgi:hypothetical protein
LLVHFEFNFFPERKESAILSILLSRDLIILVVKFIDNIFDLGAANLNGVPTVFTHAAVLTR